MAAHGEVVRQGGIERGKTPADVDDLPARVATEVVMVVTAGRLVATRLSRQVNELEDTLLRQQAQIAVNRGDSQSRNRPLGSNENLSGRQRTRGALYRLANGLPLF